MTKTKYMTIITALLASVLSMWACGVHERYPRAGDAEDLLQRVDAFYVFLLGREMGNYHNDLEEQFKDFFLDHTAYYDFLDSYMPLVKDRNFAYNTINEYYILGVEMMEDGQTSDVKLRLLSRDAPFIYRKLELTQNWYLSEGEWYPGKVRAPMLTRWTKITDLYTLPPRRR